jgi:fermentation-respiration switch protein FrsA (DUF1100 family)
MLFITGDEAHSREFSEEAYKLAGEPKQLLVIPGAGHVDLYDRVDLTPFHTLTSYFEQHLWTTHRWARCAVSAPSEGTTGATEAT